MCRQPRILGSAQTDNHRVYSEKTLLHGRWLQIEIGHRDLMDGPAYQRIAAELRENIKDGIYQVGQQIPTEDTLAGRFSVNRHTLRRAVGVLAAEGLVRVDQGLGMFVAAALVRYPVGQRVRFNESLDLLRKYPTLEVQGF